MADLYIKKSLLKDTQRNSHRSFHNIQLSTISSVLEVKATSLTKYLKTFIDLDILEWEVPVTENNPERNNKGLYKIKDNYLKLWAACAAKWGWLPKI